MSAAAALEPCTGDALIVVDVQNDFLPGGALAVPAGDAVIGPLNAILESFARRGLAIFATRDWHPLDHCSFKAQGGPWPPHCIAGSRGAAFPESLRLPPDTRVLSKAVERGRDAYSGFQGTELAQQLRALGCRRVFVAGLATDYCVRATALDALSAGFATVVLSDAVRAVDARPGDGERALLEVASRGAVLAPTQQILA